MPGPSVSVVIAAYNAASFVGAAVKSALEQEDVSLEVVVVDDVSTDTTKAVLADLAQHDQRIVTLSCSQNMGPAGARNVALEQAQGDWIAVLDSDDRYMEHRLSRMIKAGRDMDADIVLDDFVSVDEDGNVLSGHRLAERRSAGFIDLEDWVKLNGFTQSELSFGYAKPLVSQSFIARAGISYNETLRNGEDYHLVLEALVAGAKVYFTAETGYCYTRRAGSVSRRAQNDDMLALRAADAAIAERLPKTEFPAVRHRLAERQKNLVHLMVTEEVLHALKSRRPLAAARALLRRPGAAGRVFGHLTEAFNKRFRPGK